MCRLLLRAKGQKRATSMATKRGGASRVFEAGERSSSHRQTRDVSDSNKCVTI